MPYSFPSFANIPFKKIHASQEPLTLCAAEGPFQPRTKSGTRLARHERHEAPCRQQTSRERSDRVRSAVDNPVTSFPAGGGVESNGFANMPHGE